MLGAALLASAVIVVGSLGINWAGMVVTDSVPDDKLFVLLEISSQILLAGATSVPFLVAVLVAVSSPTTRTVVGGAALVYVFGLLPSVVLSLAGTFPTAVDITILAVPLESVAEFVGIVAAVWFAYHGGYDRVVDVVRDADVHPLLAAFREEGPGQSLQRPIVAAVLAAVVAVGGLVLAAGIQEFLRMLAHGGSSPAVSVDMYGDVGIGLDRIPLEWIREAAFLLAVVFVTGPDFDPVDVLKGVTAVVGVQSAVLLLPILTGSAAPAEFRNLLAQSPLFDLLTFLAIAAGAWLAFHGGLELLLTTDDRPVRG